MELQGQINPLVHSELNILKYPSSPTGAFEFGQNLRLSGQFNTILVHYTANCQV